MPNEVVAGLLLSVDARTVQARREIESLQQTMRESSRSMRAEMQETRAAIKQIGEEIGVNLNRHLISFLARIPGADMLAKAFPVAAIVGIGAAFVEAGEKLAEFVKKNRDAASEIGEAMESLQERSQTANDQLALTNAKLDVQLAKLEHKPANTLAVALAETRVEADKLAESLKRNLGEVDKLLKDKRVTFLGALATNQAPTGSMSDKIKEFNEAIEDIDKAKKAALDGVTDQARSAAITKQYDDETLKKAQEARDWAAGEWNRLHAAATAPPTIRLVGPKAVPMEQPREDTTALQTIAGGFATEMDKLIQDRRLEIANADKQGKLGAAQDAKSAAEERLRAMEQEAEKRKLLHTMTLHEETQYWAQYINAFTLGSDQWMAVQRKYQGAVAAEFKNLTEPGKLAEFMKKWKEEQGAPVPEAAQKDVGAEMMADFGHYGKSWEEYNRLVAENAQIHDKLQGALEGTSLRIAAETGQISREQAALREAEAQLAAYHAERREVRKEMSDVSGDTSLTEAQRATQLQQLRNKLDEITGQIDIKRAEAQALSDATKLRDSMAVMFNEWIRRSQDVRTQMTGLWDQFSSSMNDEMAKAITGAHTNWSGAFRGVGESAVKMGLGNVEGLLMKHIHFPGGDKHMTPKMDVQAGVVTVNGPGGAGAPGMPGAGIDYAMPVASSNPMSTFLRTVGGLLGLVKPGGASVTAPVLPTSGSSWGDFDVPAMAFGGPVLAGHAYDIGEMGRERFVPGTDGYIVPHHELTGGGVFYDVHIPAGATAAQVRQDMHRMFATMHSSAVQSAIKVQQERRRRIPSRNM